MFSRGSLGTLVLPSDKSFDLRMYSLSILVESLLESCVVLSSYLGLAVLLEETEVDLLVPFGGTGVGVTLVVECVCLGLGFLFSVIAPSRP